MSGLKVLIAVDKFKGSLTALAASQIISETISEKKPEWEIKLLPISDGGDGSLETLFGYGFDRIDVAAVDALSRNQNTYYGISKDKTIFIEMAHICGIAQLNQSELNPYEATSLGLGIAARDSLTHNPSKVIISLGGSASNDGGIGFLIGLGARALDENNNEVSPNLRGLRTVKTLDLSTLDRLALQTQWLFLTDVANPATGENGATYIYGAQKGLPKEDLMEADLLISQWADVLHRATGKDVRSQAGTGAAGAIALAGCSVLPATIESGAMWIGQLLSLEEEISCVDLVITGEGRFDRQSTMGKAPGLVIALAKKHKKQFAVVAGSIDPEVKNGLLAASLMDFAPNLNEAMSEPRKWLELASAYLLDLLHI